MSVTTIRTSLHIIPPSHSPAETPRVEFQKPVFQLWGTWLDFYRSVSAAFKVMRFIDGIIVTR